MADLVSLLGSTDGVRVLPGFAGVAPLVRVGGLTQSAVWLCDYAAPGESVIVAQVPKGDAPGELVVLGRVGVSGPREGTVTAAPVGSETITVTADGTDYVVTYNTDLTLSVGDRVRLLWQGRDATAVCKVSLTPVSMDTGGSTAPPPGASTTGVLPVPSVDSGTYSVGYGWNSYYARHLYQGDGSGWGAAADNRGAWFYGGTATQLAGATITRVEFRVPARRSAGASSSSLAAHLYLHGSSWKPGGDVTRTSGPQDVTLSPGYPGGWVDLPLGWAPTLVAGGGVGIFGSPYLGLKGVGPADQGNDPESGLIRLHWNR